MVKQGDILKVVSNISCHAFELGEKIEVVKYIGCGVFHGKGESKECLLSEVETVPVWDK